MTPPGSVPRRRARWREWLVAIVGLTLIWSLFWGGFSWLNTVGGVLVAVAVLVFYPLPPVTFAGRVRPLAVLVFLLRFLVELVVASVRLSAVALRPGPPPHSAIIAVRLRVPTDLNLTLVAEALSLVPGTLIVDVDRPGGTLFVHVFDVRGREDAARSREHVHELEVRLVRAVGSGAELAMIQTDPDGRKVEP